MDSIKIFDCTLFVGWLCFFASFSWWIDAGPDAQNITLLTKKYLLLHALGAVFYIYVLRQRQLHIPWRWAAGFIFIAALVTPSVSETDQLRYIWDGLIVWQGINPFRYAPSQVGDFHNLFWAQSINHPELNTIYPPLAQALFALSSWFNPYFWHTYLGISWAPELTITSFFQVELGWKVMTGLLAAALVYIFRHKPWHWLILHPLFLSKFVGNGNVDAVMVVCVAIALYAPLARYHERWQNIALTAGILSKWLPLILLPFFAIRWLQRYSTARAVSAIFLSIAITLFAWALYTIGANGKTFDSLLTYAQHWYFFGYIHRFIADTIDFFFTTYHAIDIAKGLCALLGAFWGLCVLLQFYRQRISLRLTCLAITMGALAVSPTIHPWYLLIILPIGLPYFHVLITPWLWPMLALASHSFYLSGQDPWLVRYCVYFIVTVVLYIDMRRVCKRLKKIQTLNFS